MSAGYISVKSDRIMMKVGTLSQIMTTIGRDD